MPNFGICEHEKRQKVAVLLDFYAPLLTKRQSDILDAYYNEDFSLAEIADNLSISRQAVHDAVKTGVWTLTDYEEKLGLVKEQLSIARNADITKRALQNIRAAVLVNRVYMSEALLYASNKEDSGENNDCRSGKDVIEEAVRTYIKCCDIVIEETGIAEKAIVSILEHV